MNITNVLFPTRIQSKDTLLDMIDRKSNKKEVSSKTLAKIICAVKNSHGLYENAYQKLQQQPNRTAQRQIAEALISNAPSTEAKIDIPMTNSDKITILMAKSWAAQSSAQGENRQEVARRIEAWITTTSPSPTHAKNPLNLDDLNLREIPPYLPYSLKSLSLNGNFITNLDKGLPLQLHTLKANRNPISSFPKNLPNTLKVLELGRAKSELSHFTEVPSKRIPPNLETLQLSHTFIKTLPASIPDSIQYINLYGSNIKHIEAFPKSLRILNIEETKIISIPKISAPKNWKIPNKPEKTETPAPSNFPLDIERIYFNPQKQSTMIAMLTDFGANAFALRISTVHDENGIAFGADKGLFNPSSLTSGLGSSIATSIESSNRIHSEETLSTARYSDAS